MARKRKRKSRRRQEGRKILELVPQYNLESGEDKPVTAARKYIASEGITPPALLIVKRNEHTTDRYFWAEKGLFGAQYVEENHFLFPSLRLIAPQNNSSTPVRVSQGSSSQVQSSQTQNTQTQNTQTQNTQTQNTQTQNTQTKSAVAPVVTSLGSR